MRATALNGECDVPEATIPDALRDELRATWQRYVD